MPWSKPRKGRELPQHHHSWVMTKLRLVKFSKEYPILCKTLGGEEHLQGVFEKVERMLKEESGLELAELRMDLNEALNGIRLYAEANGIYTATPDRKTILSFIKNLELADEHTLLRIMAHCLFIISVTVCEMEKKVNKDHPPQKK